MRALTWMTIGLLCIWAANPVDAGGFAGLTPGQSTLADAAKALGPGQLTGTHYVFSGEKFDAREIRIEVFPGADTIRAIAIAPSTPQPRDQLRRWLDLPEPIYVEAVSAGSVELYYPALVRLNIENDRVVELTHEAPVSMADRLRAAAEREQTAHRFDKAVELYTAALPEFLRDATLRNALAQALHDAGRDADAEEVLRETLSFESANEAAQNLQQLVKATIAIGRLPVIGAVFDHLIVSKVAPGSPASAAGLQPGDILRQIYAFKVRSPEDIQWALLHAPLGQPISVVVFRDDKPVALTVPYASRDEVGAVLDSLNSDEPGAQAAAWLELSQDLRAHDLAKSYAAAMRASRIVAGDPSSEAMRDKARRALMRRQRAFEAQQRASRLIDAKQWKEALDTVNELLALEPGLPAALYARAHILHFGMNRSDEALKTLASISTWPQSRSTSRALILRGDILFETKRYDEAGLCYELAWSGPMTLGDLRYLRFALANTAHQLRSPRAAALWREYLYSADGVDSEAQRRAFAQEALRQLASSTQEAQASGRP